MFDNFFKYLLRKVVDFLTHFSPLAINKVTQCKKLICSKGSWMFSNILQASSCIVHHNSMSRNFSLLVRKLGSIRLVSVFKFSNQGICPGLKHLDTTQHCQMCCGRLLVGCINMCVPSDKEARKCRVGLIVANETWDLQALLNFWSDFLVGFSSH